MTSSWKSPPSRFACARRSSTRTTARRPSARGRRPPDGSRPASARARRWEGAAEKHSLPLFSSGSGSACSWWAATDCEQDMATTTDLPSSSPAHRAPHLRDQRLDMFRGLALLLIAVTHMGGNWLAEILPSHFGFSSGTEMFVFCSGMASGLAFGNLFVKRGFWLGTVRVAHRIWQIYWAHIASFVGVLAL